MSAGMPTSIDVPRVASDLRVVLGQLIRRLRTEHRFPLSQGTVLGRLDREGPQTTSALAASERVRPQSMAQTIGDLEGDGLVARRPDPTDGRQILIELTEEGRQTLEADRRHREGWLTDAIAATLSQEEQQDLARAVPLLQRLADADA